MEKPLQIIVTTAQERYVIDGVTELLVKPHPDGMELRQNKFGWELKPREETNEKEIQMEQGEICQHHVRTRHNGGRRRPVCLADLHVDPDGVGGNNG